MSPLISLSLCAYDARMQNAVSPQRAVRIRRGMSLVEVDALTGIGVGRLSVLERLPPARLTDAVRERLARAFEISKDELKRATAESTQSIDPLAKVGGLDRDQNPHLWRQLHHSS